MSIGQANERVAVVTGASRGAGKTIAIALGAAGATVYVTGRTALDQGGSMPNLGSTAEGSRPLPGTVTATAEAVSTAAGVGIPVVCDHADDSQVATLFECVRKGRGRLDILVNNSAAARSGSPRSWGSIWG